MILDNAFPVDPVLSLWLKIASGLCWTSVYVMILRRGFIDKTYGMPMLALCANLSWEFIFSFVFPHDRPQIYIDYVWLAFDTGLLWQFYLHGKQEFPKSLPEGLFFPVFFLGIAFSVGIIVALAYEFSDFNGIYAAFGQNLMMSVLFIHMLLRRGNARGQSIYIALAKMIGTVFPSILFFNHYPHSPLLTTLYLMIFFFDVAYFLLLYRTMLRLNINPWLKV